DALEDVIFLHDREFRLIYANRAYLKQVGLPLEEILGRPYFEVFPRREGPLPHCLRALETKTEEEETFALDGNVWRSRSFPVFDEGGYRYSVHILEDITESQAHQEKLASLADTVQDALIILDQEGRIAFWNRAAERIFGYAREEALGQDMHRLIVPGHLHRAFEEGWKRFRETGQGAVIGKTLELEALRKGGEAFPAEVSIGAFPFKGRWHAVGTVRDVTGRKRREAQLQRLNRAYRTLSTGNQIMVREKDEQALTQAVCRLLVEEGGYDLAWIDVLFNGQTLPVAEWGFAEEGLNVAFPLESEGGFIGAMNVCSTTRSDIDPEEARLLSELAADLAYALHTLKLERERETHARRLQDTLFQTIQALALAMEKRDPYTAGHQKRVTELAVAIGLRMGLDERRLEGLRLAGLIHDIGNIYVPAEILNKPGQLSDIEFEIIKTHPQVGHEILKDIPFPWPVAEIVYQHHERLDG
ncbi:MAG: PAS domain S-box protein, partial [Gammaproteobacteria bacterium]